MRSLSPRRSRMSILVLSLVAAASCSHPSPTHEPQDVAPSQQVRPLDRGLASWYGKRFHGKRTASGEAFDMHALTAAHPSLPFGSIVRVTRVENGSSVTVRINDRGPFRKGRVIDLSYAAAKELRMIERGVVEVRVGLVQTER